MTTYTTEILPEVKCETFVGTLVECKRYAFTMGYELGHTEAGTVTYLKEGAEVVGFIALTEAGYKYYAHL